MTPIEPDMKSNSPQKNAPIGIFDSGKGGLSVLYEIQRQLPHERLIYINDSAYGPYGDKSPEYILARADALTTALINKNVKAIVIACNTASAYAAPILRTAHSIPIIAIEPAIKPAAALTKTNTIAVFATVATLTSPQFLTLCERTAQSLRIETESCPEWVTLVNRDEIASERTHAAVKEKVLPLLEKGADVCVLGCTHYVFLRECVEEIVQNHAHVVDGTEGIVAHLAERLSLEDLRCTDSTMHHPELLFSE